MFAKVLCVCVRTIKVVLPDPPPEYSSLPHWLSDLIDSKLKKLLDQGDFQRVRELSLALITVLNEVGPTIPQPSRHFLCKITVSTLFKSASYMDQYEQTRESVRVSRVERGYRGRVRNNITRALTALELTTVNDIQQTSAALAQCTVSRRAISRDKDLEWGGGGKGLGS